MVLGIFSAVLLALLFLALQLQRGRFERALVEDFLAFPPLEGPRPSHVATPSPGTVGQALEAALAAEHPPVPRKWRRSEPAPCADARGLPVAELPKECAEVLDALGPWARAVLAASRAEDSTLPRDLEPAGAILHPRNQQSVNPEVLAVALVSHDVRRAAAQGQADEALAWCADGLALGRDYARRQGPPGVMFAAHWAALFVGPCGEALDVASAEAKRRFADAVERIERALPDEERILRLAVATRLVDLHGATFSDQTLDALPPHLALSVRKRSPNADRFPGLEAQRQFVSDAAALRGTLGSVGQGAAARAAAFERATQRLASGPRGGELRLDEVMTRFDRLHVLLRLLVAAARLDGGELRAPPPGFTLRDEPGARVLTPSTATFARFSVRLH